VWQLGLRGADVPAQTYYVDVFRSHGCVLWDNGWYAGPFQVSYSILFPALGAILGLYGSALLCAATAAWDQHASPRSAPTTSPRRKARGHQAPRMRYTSTWAVTRGHACIQNHDGWTELVIRQPDT
jgi:hypothetical protein